MELSKIEAALLLKQAEAAAEVDFWEGIQKRVNQFVKGGTEAARVYAKLNNDDLIEVALTLSALWSMKLKGTSVGEEHLIDFCEGHNNRAAEIAEEIRRLNTVAASINSPSMTEYAKLAKPKRITKISEKLFRTRKDGRRGQLVEDAFRYSSELWISQSHLACLACMSPRSGIFEFLDVMAQGGLLKAASGYEIGANTERMLISNGWLEMHYAAYMDTVRKNMINAIRPTKTVK